MQAWMLEVGVLGWVSWVGTVVGLIGLLLTYLQAREAKRAAIGARKAVAEFATRSTLPDISYAYAQLDVLKTLVWSGEMGSARLLFGSLKRSLVLILQQDDEWGGSHSAIGPARRALRATETLLSGIEATHLNERRQSLLDPITGLLEYLAQREAELRTARFGGVDR